jgi:hypothetical protein
VTDSVRYLDREKGLRALPDRVEALEAYLALSGGSVALYRARADALKAGWDSWEFHGAIGDERFRVVTVGFGHKFLRLRRSMAWHSEFQAEN